MGLMEQFCRIYRSPVKSIGVSWCPLGEGSGRPRGSCGVCRGVLEDLMGSLGEEDLRGRVREGHVGFLEIRVGLSWGPRGSHEVSLCSRRALLGFLRVSWGS